MVSENAFGPSAIVWRGFGGPQKQREFSVTPRSPLSELSLYLVLLLGELNLFLVHNVFNRSFTGFLCIPIEVIMSVESEV
jgi:hypothetical protein